MINRYFAGTVTLLGILTFPSLVVACPIHEQRTLHEKVAESQLILYGTVHRGHEKGQNDALYCTIAAILKAHPALAGKRSVRLLSDLPKDEDIKPQPCLVFGDVVRGNIEWHTAMVATPTAVDYVKGLLAIRVQDRQALLRHWVGYLEHPDEALATDATQEIGRLPDKELEHLASVLPADQLRGWLRSPATPPERMALYAKQVGISFLTRRV